MGRKKKELNQSDVKRLDPHQYWTWRQNVYEMQLAEKDYNIKSLEYNNKSLEVKLIGNERYKSLENMNAKRKTHKDYVAILEKSLGIKIEGKCINPETLEITDDQGL